MTKFLDAVEAPYHGASFSPAMPFLTAANTMALVFTSRVLLTFSFHGWPRYNRRKLVR